MKAAPAITLDIPASGELRRVSIVLHMLAAAGVAAWTAQLAGQPGSSGPAAALAAAIVAGIGWRFWPARPACALRWDGLAWSLQFAAAAPALAVQPRVALDLGPWMLLALQRPEGGTHWVGLGRGRLAQAWRPLRRALAATRGGPRDEPA